MKYQNRYIFSDTETTGVSERDFIQIIQSASMLTDDNCRTLDVFPVHHCHGLFQPQALI